MTFFLVLPKVITELLFSPQTCNATFTTYEFPINFGLGLFLDSLF